MTNTNLFRFNVLLVRLNGRDFYCERLGHCYFACSTYAPNLSRGRGEVYHIDIMDGVEGSDVLREWLGAA